MTQVSAATKKILAVSMLKGIGPAALRKISAFSGFESESISGLAGVFSQLDRALANSSDWDEAVERAEEQIEASLKFQFRIISSLDFDYPVLLKKTKDDPFIIFVKGRLHSLPEKSVAVIGTREPTRHGGMIATRVSRYLVEQGWSVVSGLALGCDAVAHRTAIKEKGHTLAVLAHGLQTIAPASHRELADEILESGGALVSEYPFGTKPQPQFFVKRDRTQAGLAQGVVMVQSDIKGGSLHASRAALDYGRWLAVPYPTEEDIENKEPKIQANLTMANGGSAEKLGLLRCSNFDLERLNIIRGKDDYDKLISASVFESEGGLI